MDSCWFGSWNNLSVTLQCKTRAKVVTGGWSKCIPPWYMLCNPFSLTLFHTGYFLYPLPQSPDQGHPPSIDKRHVTDYPSWKSKARTSTCPRLCSLTLPGVPALLPLCADGHFPPGTEDALPLTSSIPCGSSWAACLLCCFAGLGLSLVLWGAIRCIRMRNLF